MKFIDNKHKEFWNRKYKEMEERLVPIAQKLGITDLLEKYPYEVSGGQ